MTRTRGDRGGSLRRRPPFREPKRRILVLCEGQKTEPTYLKTLSRVHRSLVEVQIEGRGEDPRTLVRAASQRQVAARKAAKAAGDPNLAYDEVWCVFDIDDHHYVAEARDQAQANGVALAISNPCFELWLLLHLQDQTAQLSRKSARAKLKHHLPQYDKVAPYEQIQSGLTAALQRAESLERRCEKDGEPCRNPSTGAYRLVFPSRSKPGCGAHHLLAVLKIDTTLGTNSARGCQAGGAIPYLPAAFPISLRLS